MYLLVIIRKMSVNACWIPVLYEATQCSCYGKWTNKWMDEKWMNKVNNWVRVDIPK